jgi:ABC-type lipoprotein export system ATPase subunit
LGSRAYLNYQLRTNRSRKEVNNRSSEGQEQAGQPHGWGDESRTAEATLENPPANLFEATELKKHFDDGDVEALRNLNLQVQESEFVAVTGPSGCGKTTLLQLLGALDRPTAGRLLYRGTSIPDLPDPSAYRSQEIGFIFQAFHLLPTFTALENVQIPMLETGLSRSERKDRAIELLKSVGLEQRRNHFPSKLSGGERQRVAIARSLANSPSVLLADEPTGNLDSDNTALVLDLLRQIHQEKGMTLVLVTHDSSVAQHASRIIHMIDGHVVSDRHASIDKFCL